MNLLIYVLIYDIGNNININTMDNFDGAMAPEDFLEILAGTVGKT